MFLWRHLFKISALILFILVCLSRVSSAHAATYYISQTDGHDTSCTGLAPDAYVSGTGQSCPWKTIAKVNASSFMPGDSILFKRGDIWREELTIPSAGNSTNKIIFSAYGTGDKPKIYGSDVPTSWTQEIYTPPQTITLTQGGTAVNSSASVSRSFTSQPTSGSLLVAVGWGTNSDTNATITGWNKAVSANYSGGSYMTLFYKTATESESSTVTLNWTGSTQTRLAIEEWSGLTNPTLDQIAFTNTTGSTTTSVSSGTTPTTTSANELIIAAFGHGSNVTNRSYTNGFVEDYDVGGSNTWQVASKTVSATDTYTTTQSWTTSRQAGGLIATFKGDEVSETLYYTSQTDDPGDIWFITDSDDIIHQEPESSKAALIDEYDWWYDSTNDRLYLNSPSNPSTRYSSVEVASPNRDRGIGWDNTNYGYVDVSQFEVAFVNGVGIVLRTHSNISQNTVHHISDANNHGYGLEINTGSSNTINNNIVYETQGAAFYTTASYDDHVNSNITLEHNTFYNSKTQLILISTGTQGLETNGTVIRYNLLYHENSFNPDSGQGNGITIQGRSGVNVTNTQIYYNVISLQTGSAIALYDYVATTTITNNSLSSTNGRGIYIAANNSSVTVLNNLVAQAGLNALRVVDSNAITQLDYNLLYSSSAIVLAYIDSTSYYLADLSSYRSTTGWDNHGIWSDPYITSLSTRDFSLLSNSPARNAGIATSYNSDYAGNNVPQGEHTDIGAYEYLQVASGGTSPSSSHSTASNDTSSTVNTSCDVAPLSSQTPYIHSITRTGTSATLIWTSIDEQVDRYIIEYSPYTTLFLHAYVLITQIRAPYVYTTTINSLDAKQPYYFRIRGALGCRGGTWSNVFPGLPTSSTSRIVVSPSPQAQATNVVSDQPLFQPESNPPTSHFRSFINASITFIRSILKALGL